MFVGDCSIRVSRSFMPIFALVSLLRLYSNNIIAKIHVKLLIPGITPGIILSTKGEEKRIARKNN